MLVRWRPLFSSIPILLLVAVLSGCQSSKQASAVTQAGEQFIGYGENRIGGGVIQIVSQRNGAVCSSSLRYFRSSANFTTASIMCTDGRTGAIKLFRNSHDKVDFGTFALNDGSQGKISFGSMYSFATANSNASKSEYNPNSGYYEKKGNSCKSEGYYGENSCLTGRSKTVHVRGYYRKNGTYVKPHYRSPPRR